MPDSSRRSRRPAFLLSIPAVVLATTLAAPAHAADPGGDPNGGEGRNASQGVKKGPKAAPGSKAQGPKEAPGSKAQGPKQAPGSKAQGPKPKPAPAPAPAPGAGDTPPGEGEFQPEQRKVVICKYVRKPGVTEIPHHVIIVDYHALKGQGFAGSFPYPFSDAQVGSVAVRYAEDGEQAKDVSLAGCPASVPPVEEVPGGGTPGGETPGEETPGEESPVVEVPAEGGEVGGVSVEASAEGSPAERVAPAAAADENDGILPATGSPAYLAMMALLGAVCTAAGAALLVARRRRSIA